MYKNSSSSSKKNVKNFDNHKKSSRELVRAEESDNRSNSSSSNGIKVPALNKVGYIVEIAHKIPRETHLKRLVSTEDTDVDDDDDFRSTHKKGLYMPKNSISAQREKREEELFMPKRYINIPRQQQENDENTHSPEKTLMIPPKRKINPFASGALKMPLKKKRIDKDEEELSRLQERFKINQKNDERELEEDRRKCIFCSETLFPITEPISKALKIQEKKDKEYAQKQKEHFDDLNSTSSFSRPIGFENTRPVPSDEKDEFCKLHRLELVFKPDGIKNGYPKDIDFNKLEKDVKKFYVELKEVICGEISSDYKDIAERAYKEQGQTKARSMMSVLHRFKVTLPGYYGPRGAAKILKTLTKMYFDTGYLADHLVSSQLPLEYLQQVLVPEVGFRLIRRDLISKGQYTNATERAKVIMKESAAYGNAMFPVEDAQIDEDEDQHQHQDYGNNNDNDDDDDDEVEINEVYTIDSD
ncbi:hypothetical protein INT46_005375 [Mucor plumbeus]|uniref:Restriction of telomere capping protein 4 n=1 Tax=Mucor plumbeus TaxID=97098 RepID=A0A8H7QTB1_9FUNG|nr:hypothetical protein INT46_005375 [Mucor plumbeus]